MALLTIYLRGGDGTPQSQLSLKIDNRDVTQLRSDFLKHLSEGAPQGGAYDIENGDGAKGQLHLRFNDVSAITSLRE